MSIQVDAKAFVRALGTAALAIERRNTIPIIGCVRLQRAGDALVLSGTNLDQQIDVTIAAEANGAALSAALPDPRMLARVLKAAGAETLALDHDGDLNKTALAAGDFALSLDSLPSEDFPDVRVSDAPAFCATLGEEAISAIRRVSGAASTEETRYYLNGVYLHKSGEPWAYSVVATDGHRLYMADFPLPDAAGALDPSGVIIPRGTVQRLLTLANGKPIRFAWTAALGKNATDTLAPAAAPTRVRFDLGEARLISKLIDGAFPDYRRVVPGHAPHLATFDRAALQRAVATMRAFSSEKLSIALEIKLAGGTAHLARKWHGSGEARTMLPYEGGAHVTFGINARYLADLLDGFAACERVTFAFEDEYQHREDSGPIIVASPQDCGFKAVIMPMRV